MVAVETFTNCYETCDVGLRGVSTCFKKVTSLLACNNRNSRIFVDNICLITISDTVSDGVAKTFVLYIERAKHD